MSRKMLSAKLHYIRSITPCQYQSWLAGCNNKLRMQVLYQSVCLWLYKDVATGTVLPLFSNSNFGLPKTFQGPSFQGILALSLTFFIPTVVLLKHKSSLKYNYHDVN